MKLFSRKPFILSFIFIFILSIFIFTASIEYRRNISIEKQKIRDRLRGVRHNFENIITSRMISSNALSSYAELKSDFTQEEYNVFAKKIYESTSDVIQNLTFITNTTITHIYPYETYKDAIGSNLAEVISQREAILFTKDTNRSVFVAPVELVQGGLGIVVRIPVSVNEEYFGQVAIVFNYDKTMEITGIKDLGKDNYIYLLGSTPLYDEKKIIWSNTNDHIKGIITEEINFYDSTLTLIIRPKKNLKGSSDLFYMILIIGFISALLSTYIIHKLLEAKENLEKKQKEIINANKQLISINEELDAAFNQLKAGEALLKEQYDEIKSKEEYIQFLADHDPLTGLYTRRNFMEELSKELNQNNCGSIFLIDIDNFKNINDTLGHPYGDKVLTYVSKLFRELGKTINFTAYRIGGDEFLLLFKGLCNTDDINKSINKIIGICKNKFEIGNIKNQITISTGIAIYPLNGKSVEELLVKADIAMYNSKHNGKNRYSYFTDEMNSIFGERVQLEQLLNKALETSNFKLLYQAVIDSSTGRVAYFEALLRIKDNIISPAKFIPVAEESGLIIQIGRWVISEVLKQLRDWIDRNLNPKPVAINISPIQMYDESLVEFLQSEMKKYNIDSSLIELEVTENIFIDNKEDSLKVLESLKSLGISLALDDFGTGYSSLNYLTYIPVNKVKLDKSLKDKFINLDNIKILDDLISLIERLGLKVVAEGIEEESEVARLIKGRCNYLQGYLFSKPIEVSEAEILFEKDFFKNTMNKPNI